MLRLSAIASLKVSNEPTAARGPYLMLIASYQRREWEAVAAGVGRHKSATTSGPIELACSPCLAEAQLDDAVEADDRCTGRDPRGRRPPLAPRDDRISLLVFECDVAPELG
jgi:hypothetical protein